MRFLDLLGGGVGEPLGDAEVCEAAFVALDAGAGFVVVESRRAGIDAGSARFCVLVSGSTTLALS